MTTWGDDDASDDGRLRREYRDLARAEAAGSVHPSEHDWVRFADDAMSGDEHARLVDHLAVCVACADVYRVVVQVRDGAPSVAPQAWPQRRVSRPRAWYGLAAAAVLAIAVSGTLWMTRGRRAATPDQTATNTATTPTPVASAASPGSSPVVPPPGPRAWAALPLAPAVTLPASLTLVMRGAAPESQVFLRAFGAAIAPYREGRYADAATALGGLTRSFPDVPEGWYYLGVSHLLAGSAGAAIEPLQRATVSGVVGDDAAWLHAVALERAGRTDEASAALRTLCAGTGPARRRACEAEGSTR
jgi:predicted Zn-dependent protease